MDSLTRRICNELIKFLGEEFVRCYGDTISFFRHDTYKRMLDLNNERYKAWYSAAIWIDEEKGNVGSGDVVVPIELTENMKKKLESFGCKIPYIHTYENFKVSHVHMEDCRILNRIKEFISLISE